MLQYTTKHITIVIDNAKGFIKQVVLKKYFKQLCLMSYILCKVSLLCSLKATLTIYKYTPQKIILTSTQVVKFFFHVFPWWTISRVFSFETRDVEK